MAQRDHHLDFLRGFLVMVMVVYHAMNYFSASRPEYYGYLRFVNGAFVFLSGYTIALFRRSDGAGLGAAASRKLALRGLRLLLLFTALNLLIGVLGLTSYKRVEFGAARFFGSAYEVYVTGDSNAMAFRILVPIAYVIILSPLYLRWPAFTRTANTLTLAGAAAYTLLVDPVAPNAFFLLVGLAGLSIGLETSQYLNAAPRAWPVILAGLAAAVVLMNWLSGNVLAYCVGIAVVLKLVYDASRKFDIARRGAALIVLTGQYSLLCYIAQIAFLHLLRRLVATTHAFGFVELASVCLVTAAFLVALCAGLARLRRRSRWVDSAYRLGFG